MPGMTSLDGSAMTCLARGRFSMCSRGRGEGRVVRAGEKREEGPAERSRSQGKRRRRGEADWEWEWQGEGKWE
jgi:hypothetical protein